MVRIRKPFLIGITLLILAVAEFAFVGLRNAYLVSLQDNSFASCFDGYSSSMTSSQLSELVGVPLISLRGLPDNIITSPQLRPDVIDYGSSISCGIAFEYAGKTQSKKPQLVVKVHRQSLADGQNNQRPSNINCAYLMSPIQQSPDLASNPLSNSLNCVDYTIFQDTGFKSSCTIRTVLELQEYYIVVLSQYSAEFTGTLICDGMSWN